MARYLEVFCGSEKRATKTDLPWRTCIRCKAQRPQRVAAENEAFRLQQKLMKSMVRCMRQGLLERVWSGWVDQVWEAQEDTRLKATAAKLEAVAEEARVAVEEKNFFRMLLQRLRGPLPKRRLNTSRRAS